MFGCTGSQSATGSGFSLQEFEVYLVEGQRSCPPGDTQCGFGSRTVCPPAAVPYADGGDTCFG